MSANAPYKNSMRMKSDVVRMLNNVIGHFSNAFEFLYEVFEAFAESFLPRQHIDGALVTAMRNVGRLKK